MNTNDYYSRLNEQDVASLHLEQIIANYKPTKAYLDEVAIESPGDENNPAKLHLCTHDQSNHIRDFEKEALAHWVA